MPRGARESIQKTGALQQQWGAKTVHQQYPLLEHLLGHLHVQCTELGIDTLVTLQVLHE